MQGKLPAWLKLPCSAALPFGAFEAVLGHHANAHAASAVQDLSHVSNPTDEQLADLRCLLLGLEAPPEVQQQVSNALEDSGKRRLNLSFWLSCCRATDPEL